MQHLEFAFSLSKHLMAMSSAIVALIFAFIGDFQPMQDETPKAIEVIFVIFVITSALSILCGLFGLGYITNLAERAERGDGFVSLFQDGAGIRFFQCQQIFFFVSILALIMPLLDLVRH